VVLIRTGTAEVHQLPIKRRALVHDAGDVHLGHARRHAVQTPVSQRLRDFVEEIVDLLRADRGEHLRDVGLGMRNEWHEGALAQSSRLPR
jgi:hypothetical protein